MTTARTLQELRPEISAQGQIAAIIAYAGDKEEVWSFAALADAAACVAHGLIARGIGPGQSVAIIAPNGLRWVAAFWAIITTGATAAPLDVQISDSDLPRLLQTANCRWAFTTTGGAERLSRLAPTCQAIIVDADESCRSGETWEKLLAAPATECATVGPHDEAVIVFTSGTTGTPKAVPLTHANLLTNVRALAATGLVGRGDRALLPLPLHHAYPLTIGMITPLALGCGVVLPAGISGPELVAAMRQGQATAVVGVPRLYTALLDNLRRGISGAPPLARRSLSVVLAIARAGKRHGLDWPGELLLGSLRRKLAPRLRLLVSGGAPLQAEVEAELGAMGWQMLTGYGLVETSSMLTFNPPEAALPGAAGKPVPGMELRIANPAADKLGEIEVRGPSLFAEYRGDPEKTRSAFTADGWFRTGDLGSIDSDGYLHIAARKSETIVLADGKKLFPEEFETVYGAAPLIRELALLGRDGALFALVVPDLAAARDAGALRLEDAIREGLAAKARLLPSYARLTGFAVAHEALPRTQLGKIRRHLLPPLYDAARRHEAPPAPTELSPEDRTLLAEPSANVVWHWLEARFADRTIQLDTVPQIDLAIDSLGWVDLTLALERDLGVVLKESAIARIVTLRDFLREAVAAPKVEKGAASIGAEATWLAPLGPGAMLFRTIGELLLGVAMRSIFRLRVEGCEFLPAQDPILFCPNHVSYLDPFALGMALPKKRLHHTCWGGWTGVAFTTRLRRFFSRVARVIPIDPDRAAAAGLAMGSETLARGWNLVWFPEGARSADGTLQRFLPGIGAILRRHPVPIVPVSIEGTFAAWPAARKLPRPGRLIVRFGKPIDPASLPAEADERLRDQEIAAAIQAQVAALAGSETVRA